MSLPPVALVHRLQGEPPAGAMRQALRPRRAYYRMAFTRRNVDQLSHWWMRFTAAGGSAHPFLLATPCRGPDWVETVRAYRAGYRPD